MIAGEGIIGVLLAILAVAGVADRLDVSPFVDTGLAGALLLLAVLVVTVVISGTKSGKDEQASV